MYLRTPSDKTERGFDISEDTYAAETKYADPYEISAFHRTRLQENGGGLTHYLKSIPKQVKYNFLPHYWGGPPSWRLKLRSFSGERVLPDFACIGAIKSGTSDLSTYLFQHPSIIPPLTKEIFSDDPTTWPIHYPTVKECRHVEGDTGNASTGYFAPWMHRYTLIENYHKAVPDAKVILVLRNPADRAYSHYKWDLFTGGGAQKYVEGYDCYSSLVNLSLSLFPGVPHPSPSGFSILETGIYLHAVRKWLQVFGAENLHIVRAEDFFGDRIETVRGIHRFLGLDPVSPTLHKIVNQNPLDAPPEDSRTRRKVLDFYEPWNDKLYRLLDRDMNWT